MTNWKKVKIISKSRNDGQVGGAYPYPWVSFYLDDSIIYRDGTNKRIDCYERVPFTNHQVEDYIEINLDVTRYKSKDDYFDESAVRKENTINQSQQVLVPTRSILENIKGKAGENQLEKVEMGENDRNRMILCPSFTPELIQRWQSLGFTHQQVRDWINIGLKPIDFNFCAWFRDVKQLTPEETLNHCNQEELNQEFFTWYQSQLQSQIQIPPK